MLWRGIVMAKDRYRIFMSMCIYLLFTGCATVGKPFDTTRVDEVRKGQGEDEIVAWFGAPTRGNELSLADSPHHCVKRYRYNFATSDESHVLWIDFDTRNTVCNVIYSGGPS